MFPSKLELNPLVIKEALTYDLPIFMNNLKVIEKDYVNDYRISYLSFDSDKDAKFMLSNYKIKKKYTSPDDFRKMLSDNYTNETQEAEIVKDENETVLNYNMSFLNGAKVELFGDSEQEFDVDFINRDTNSIEYSTKLKSNQWSKTNSIYYKNWKILIKKDNKVLVEHDLDLKGKNVFIQFDTKSLGDNIAYVAYVEEFRKKHECNIICSTFWNNLYEKEYPEITFIKPGENPLKPDEDLYAKYSIGWYQPWKGTHNPNDYKKIPLQQTATDILDLEYKEIIPKITKSNGVRPVQGKYVCIAQFSTANAKHWHYPYKNSQLGWQMLVDWLNAQGYKVMVISKQATSLKNVIDRTGNFPIEHRINELQHCDFFIGIGSGLSWLAWALHKKVVMISGFSETICEFKTNNIRVENKSVCNGCFNRFEFDKGDWDWCPEHKDTERQFECTINITPEMVIDTIIDNKLIEETTKVDFGTYFTKAENIKLEHTDLNVVFDETKNRVSIGYKLADKTPKMNVDIVDSETGKVYQTLSDVILCNEYMIWTEPKEKLKDKDTYLRFYTDETILKYNI
jgi:autotransporter strand-loop-strand O-heptosyltransferase